jgi:PAS domain S-box-containing protein
MPDIERFYRVLAHDSPDAIVYADAKGIIGFWNKSAERIFGFSVAETLGKSLDIIIPESLRERHWKGYRETVRTGTSRCGASDVLAVPALRKDGTRISVEFTILPFRDSAGRTLGMAAMLRDVTKRLKRSGSAGCGCSKALRLRLPNRRTRQIFQMKFAEDLQRGTV